MSQQSINYAVAASLFEGVDKVTVNELLEELEKHPEAIDRAFVMLCDDQGKLTAAKVSALTLPALKLLCSAGQPFCTSELACKVVEGLVAAKESTPNDTSAQRFGSIVNGYTPSAEDFKSPAFAIQQEVLAMQELATPRPLCWVMAVSPFLTSTVTAEMFERILSTSR
jgi:hypothetical protein